jgi:hypothetical protein
VSDETVILSISTAQQCHALLEMCDHLQMTAVQETIWKLARAQLTDPKAVGLSPWETFKLGSVRDLPMLCFDVVSAFVRYRCTIQDICGKPAEFYADVPGRYVAMLLNDNYFTIHGGYAQCSMTDIADRFKNMHLERSKGSLGA